MSIKFQKWEGHTQGDLAGQRKLKPKPEMGRRATNKQQAHWCGGPGKA